VHGVGGAAAVAGDEHLSSLGPRRHHRLAEARHLRLEGDEAGEELGEVVNRACEDRLHRARVVGFVVVVVFLVAFVVAVVVGFNALGLGRSSGSMPRLRSSCHARTTFVRPRLGLTALRL
jgi:hypothetical protein